MQKSQFKHKEGDIIETTAGTYGKVVSYKVVYEIAFGKNESVQVDEDDIITAPKQKRTRKAKIIEPGDVVNSH